MKDTVSRERAQIASADRAALVPYTIWAVLFILVPLVFVAYYAFTDNAFHFTLENVKRFFTATHVQGPGTGTSLVSGIPAALFFPEHPPTEETR